MNNQVSELYCKWGKVMRSHYFSRQFQDRINYHSGFGFSKLRYV